MHTKCFWLQRSPLTASPAHVNLQPGLGIIPTLFGLNNTSGEALKVDASALPLLSVARPASSIASCLLPHQSDDLTPSVQATVALLSLSLQNSSTRCGFSLQRKCLAFPPVSADVYHCFVQAFLSRLLLMLGSFVIMCLLLF